jgi:hypothetical protein
MGHIAPIPQVVTRSSVEEKRRWETAISEETIT